MQPPNIFKSGQYAGQPFLNITDVKALRAAAADPQYTAKEQFILRIHAAAIEGSINQRKKNARK